MPKPKTVTSDIADAKNAVVFMPSAAVVTVVDGKGAKFLALTEAQFREIKAILERAVR